MPRDGVIEVSPDDYVMILLEKTINECYHVVDKGRSWMNVVLSLSVQCQSLLVPGGVPDCIGGLFVDLVNAYDGDGFHLFPTHVYVTPSS